MQLLILSDVHANLFALRAALETAPTHEVILCLGDIVGYGAQPNECCDLLCERDAICLAGNHDAAACGHPLIERFNAVARASTEWTQTQLTTENRAFLESLPPHRVFEEWRLEAVHASLAEPLEGYIQGIHSARPTWDKMQFDLCFFGHTHDATSLAELNVTGRRYETEVLSWKDGGHFTVRGDGWKTLVNPGSIGQPRDGNPLARYALFDTQTREVTIFAVPYDVEAAQRSIIDANLPAQLAERLTLGK